MIGRFWERFNLIGVCSKLATVEGAEPKCTLTVNSIPPYSHLPIIGHFGRFWERLNLIGGCFGPTGGKEAEPKCTVNVNRVYK